MHSDSDVVSNFLVRFIITCKLVQVIVITRLNYFIICVLAFCRIYGHDDRMLIWNVILYIISHLNTDHLFLVLVF